MEKSTGAKWNSELKSGNRCRVDDNSRSEVRSAEDRSLNEEKRYTCTIKSTLESPIAQSNNGSNSKIIVDGRIGRINRTNQMERKSGTKRSNVVLGRCQYSEVMDGKSMDRAEAGSRTNTGDQHK